MFVSYSRADREAVVGLVAGLDARGLRAWVDLEDIPPSAEWMAEIRAAIEASDGYVVMVSPDLARSRVCVEELEFARDAGKRIVPVMVRSTDAGSVPGALAALNWIDGTGGELDDALDRAVDVLRTDLDHVRAHTKLGVRAAEWERKNDEGLVASRRRDRRGRGRAGVALRTQSNPGSGPVCAGFQVGGKSAPA